MRQLLTSGDGVEVVVGKAGAGKTSALAAAAAAWRADGVPVLSTAVAARAALAFGEQAGIPAMTVARLLAALDRRVDGRPAGLAPGSALIVDEAGMLVTRLLARLLTHVPAAGGKLVLVGDHRQLPELDAGGAFAALAKTLSAAVFTENRWQAQDWERYALDELRHGDPNRCSGVRPARTPERRWSPGGGPQPRGMAPAPRRLRWSCSPHAAPTWVS